MERDKEEFLDLMQLLSIVLDRKWLIVIVTSICSLIGVSYAILVAPTYSANASIQVSEKSSNLLKGFSTLLEQDSSANTEIPIIKSRMVLGKVVEELNLTTEIVTDYTVPFFSEGFSRLSGIETQLKIKEFIPKTSHLNSIILEIVDSGKTYHLYENTGKLILEGEINRKYVNDDFIIQVSLLEGPIGQRFTLNKITELEAIDRLQAKLNVIEKGKQTGIIEISINGKNPRYIEEVVKSVSESYLLQNIAQNSEEASKTLDFLKDRLPEVREKLAESENTLNEYLQKHGTVDLNLETKSILDTLVQLDADLNTIMIKESEISKKFTKNHPSYIALLEQKKILQKEKSRLSKEVSNLPDTQREVVRLTRDLEVEQQIYVQLLNKIQELGVVKAGIIGNVRILDVSQVLPKPIAPKKAMIVLLSTFLGVVLSIVFVLAKGLFKRGISNVDDIEAMGLPVYATIPYSKSQIKIKVEDISKMERKFPLLSELDPADISIEALRSLRTSVYFAMQEARNNIVMFSGASPAVGKSFVSTNLANVIAKTGKKVLLIDFDLRKSYLQYLFNLKSKTGLAEVISQNIPFEQGTQTLEYGFDILVRGKRVLNPAEILANLRTQQLLEWASQNYDLVIIDTPPILAVTDAAMIGRYVGTAFLIGYFEKTTLKEIEIARRIFERAGTEIKGFIFNGIVRKASNQYHYYNYEYK